MSAVAKPLTGKKCDGSRRTFRCSTPTLCANGIDLLERMLAYEPYKRITSRAAMAHPYFADLDRSLLPTY